MPQDQAAQAPAAKDPGAQEGRRQAQGALLSELSNEMVRIQKRFWGRGAVEAKSYLLDDLLLIVMRGGLTVAEESMLANGHEDEVRAFRQLWENDMRPALTAMVEDRTGRRVANYQSQIMFDPDVVVEMFLFARDDAPTRPASEVPASGTLAGVVGVATRAALDAPPETSVPAGDDDDARGRGPADPER